MWPFILKIISIEHIVSFLITQPTFIPLYAYYLDILIAHCDITNKLKRYNGSDK
ncbi:hypothetical protein VQ7734_03477 [Vibrio quintilis]|uniref:Uncharacterized protein n=1 Tax=Vibrio quintilis TaxID=1117707 RepID=A0A1M7YYF0_9VIBR|nr:hypothetical protein VQ7734_03477 [Vibrio quintilis]